MLLNRGGMEETRTLLHATHHVWGGDVEGGLAPLRRDSGTLHGRLWRGRPSRGGVWKRGRPHVNRGGAS